MPSRDYLLRLIEQVGQLLARVIEQRQNRAPHEALQSVMAACERLFGLAAVEVFQHTPDQHVRMLADGEPPETARDKILMYAALTAEAGRCYAELGNPPFAQQSFYNALRLTLRARRDYPAERWPSFAPNVDDLLLRLADTPLDHDTAALLAATRSPTSGK